METSETKETKKDKDNIIFIGSKPFMNYVTAVIMQYSKNDTTEVILKARGKFINRAVDVSEVAMRRFLKDKEIKVTNILTGSEEYTNKENKKANVSIIEITLGK